MGPHVAVMKGCPTSWSSREAHSLGLKNTLFLYYFPKKGDTTFEAKVGHCTNYWFMFGGSWKSQFFWSLLWGPQSKLFSCMGSGWGL